jgi:hypothetical protein
MFADWRTCEVIEILVAVESPVRKQPTSTMKTQRHQNSSSRATMCPSSLFLEKINICERWRTLFHWLLVDGTCTSHPALLIPESSRSCVWMVLLTVSQYFDNNPPKPGALIKDIVCRD